ncbi:hypothetical protein EZS27_000256 [termite gut metagenome]|uniref:SusD/RagB family nutrient-binding outer membrane lipoprotein n=1 Tax=termite gut metagenome TaxID=433724 RepID=A0A5J4T1E9_9ZZZZ
MILNKKIWSKVSLMYGLVVLFNVACTDTFKDYNTNKHEATEEMMSYDNLKTGSFFTQMLRNVVLFDDGKNLSSDYQIAQGLSSDFYSGYTAPTGDWNNRNHNGSYNFVTGWLEMTFKSGFTGIMPAWQSIVKIAEEQDLPEIAAIATIVKVEAMHRVADTYGPIPYINFGSGNLKNDYDALEDVYKKFFEELDNAIDALTNYALSNPKILEKFDYIYAGDAVKWVKFANTLRLRLAMRVVYAAPALAQAEAEKSISNSIGVITEISEQASLKHTSNLTYFHPLYEIAYNFNGGEVRMNASMDVYMNGYNDPRREAYFTPASSGYHGVRLGVTANIMDNYKNGTYISNLNMDKSSTKIIWMTAAESYFLRAEGALRGWAMNGNARDLYERGIAVSFEENGVQGVSNYITNSASVPSSFVDNAVGSSNNYAAPSNITIAWNSSGVLEENLERIITQKWIAMFPDGPEGWAEFRRTGYPKLLPVVTNNSNGTIDTNIQIRRLPYPQSEYQNNSDGVASGVSKLGGADNGGTRLWWDKK